jgi:hypothetical protein
MRNIPTSFEIESGQGNGWLHSESHGESYRSIAIGTDKSEELGGPMLLLFCRTRSQNGYFGAFWCILVHFGAFWIILDYFGLFWIILDYFGLFWIILDYFGLFWIILS